MHCFYEAREHKTPHGGLGCGGWGGGAHVFRSYSIGLHKIIS